MIDATLMRDEIATCIPCFSAIMWILMLLIARHDSYTIPERNIKQTLLWSYGFSALVWLSFFTYNYYPFRFIYLNSFAYLAALLTAVIYYDFICRLTSRDTQKHISAWHYIVAASAPGALLVWSFFVPFDVQEELVVGRGRSYPGYESYSILFLSKPVMIFIYGTVYTAMSIRKLFVYYKEVKKNENAPIRLTGWVVVLTVIALSILLFSLFMFLVPRSRLTSVGVFWGLILLSCSQHIVLGYNVIRRNFLLYMVKEKAMDENTANASEKDEETGLQKRKYKRTSELNLSPQGKLVSVPITRKRFESYMQEHKPYLNPKLKITDLIDPLKANRTAISNFVNKTYGFNFNRYINYLRLREMERLQKMPSNMHVELSTLATMAGFANIRHYRRAMEAKQKESADNNA